MKKTILTILTTVALTFGATTLYNNYNIKNIQSQHQAQVEQLQIQHQEQMTCIVDSMDNFIYNYFVDNYSKNMGYAERIYSKYHLIMSINEARENYDFKRVQPNEMGELEYEE